MLTGPLPSCRLVPSHRLVPVSPGPWGLAVLLLLTAAGPLFGRVWVVDPSGAGDAMTIQQAADRAGPGDVVRIKAGVYRESVSLSRSGHAGGPIVFEAERPGEVVIDGADVIDGGFRRLGGRAADAGLWWTAWPHAFAIDVVDGARVEHHPSHEPLWGRAETVWVTTPDGRGVNRTRPLRPTLTLDDVRAIRDGGPDALRPPVRGTGERFAGAFHVDTKRGVLTIWLEGGIDPGGGMDPNNVLVEASARPLLLGVTPWDSGDRAGIEGGDASGVRHVHVKGMVFRRAANFPQRAAVWLHGSDNLVEDCVIERNGGVGVRVDGALRFCRIEGNGHVGGSAVGNGFVNEFNVWRGNAWKPIDRGWEAGGAKITRSAGGVVRQCVFMGNGGHGLWLDIDVRDVRVSESLFASNELSGVYIELSTGVTVEKNLMLHNGRGVGDPGDAWGYGGVTLAESAGCEVRQNTILANRDGVAIREQGPRGVDTPAGEVMRVTRGHEITGNLIADNGDAAGGGHQLALWWDNPFFGPHPTPDADPPDRLPLDPAAAGLRIDGNTYRFEPVGERDPAAVPFLWGVPWRAGSRTFADLASFTRASELERSGGMADAGRQANATLGPVPSSPAAVQAWLTRTGPRWAEGGRPGATIRSPR